MEKIRNFHPIVDKYVNTGDSLAEITAGERTGRDDIVEALRLLQDYISGSQSANGAFLAAKNVILRDIDMDLCILFLSSWAHAAYIQSQNIKDRIGESWTLLHRTKALVSPETPPEIKAYVDVVEAILIGSEGNRTSQEAIIKKTLRQLSKSSPRYNFFMLYIADFMARSGRLEEIEASLNRINRQDKQGDSYKHLATARFVNMVETGRIDQAEKLLKEIQPGQGYSATTKNISRHRLLLQLMTYPSIPGQNEDNARQPDLPDWALVIQSLLSRHINQALRWARICEKNNQSFKTGQDFMSFNLVRAELAEGNADAARRLMEMRSSCGNINYIDAFFNSRIELIAGNMDNAVHCFSELLSNLDKYKASGRIAFELRLAPELSSEMVFKLTRSAESISNSKRNTLVKSQAQHQITSTNPDATGIDRIIGISQSISSVRETILHLSSNNIPVLISGETGTGKELVARALHESGSRRDKPFVAINCGAISESLLESELFGHEKGAFSGASTAHQGLFEEAGDGTILLDEIGEITPRLQVVLLRVIETNEIRPVGSSQSKKINCRILASTNADLEELVEQNKFRKDLLFRLRRLEISITPLRERIIDIIPTAEYFLNTGRPQGINATISPELSSILEDYEWPGNVRELKNSIERMRLMNSDKLYYDSNDFDMRSQQDAYPTTTDQVPTLQEVKPSRQYSTPRPYMPSVKEKLVKGKSRIRRLLQLRELFMTHELLTRGEIIEATGISPNTATEDLKVLCNEAFIEKIQPTLSPRSIYFVLKKSRK